MKRYFALIAALLLVPLAHSATLTTFVNGEVADAAAVNANFEGLNTETTANTTGVAANLAAAAGIGTNTANIATNSTAIAGLAGGGDAVPITRVVNPDCAVADALQTSIDGAAVGKVQVNLAGTCVQDLVVEREVEIIGPAIISGHVTIRGHGRLRLVNMEVSSSGGADTGVTFVNSTVAVVGGALEMVDSVIDHTEDADMTTFEIGVFTSANATVSLMGGTIMSAAATELESSAILLTGGTSLAFQSGINAITGTGAEEGIAVDCITGGTVFAVGGTNTLTGGGMEPFAMLLEGGCHADMFRGATFVGGIELEDSSSLFLSNATVNGRLQVSSGSSMDLDDEDGAITVNGGCDPAQPFNCHRVDSNSTFQASTDGGGGLSITGPFNVNSNSSFRLQGDASLTGDLQAFQLSSISIGAFDGGSTTVTGDIEVGGLSSFQGNGAYTVSGDVSCFGTSESFVRVASVAGNLVANNQIVVDPADPNMTQCHSIDTSVSP